MEVPLSNTKGGRGLFCCMSCKGAVLTEYEILMKMISLIKPVTIQVYIYQLNRLKYHARVNTP